MLDSLLDLTIRPIIELALREDVGSGDLTTLATVPPLATGEAVIRAKEPGVIAGIPVATLVFQTLDPAVQVMPLIADGQHVTRGAIVARLAGPLRAILMGERTALNFLQRMSGIATLTSQYVAAVAGTRAVIVDTRKTAPGLRVLDKYAVRMGGARNHRFGLADGILIKDNHIIAAGGIAHAIDRARRAAPHPLRIEIEVKTLDELDAALAAGADLILLDNMTTEMIAEAVRRTAGRALLEASGGMSLERVRAVAETGVDLISVGALTHSVRALDLSLDVIGATGTDVPANMQEDSHGHACQATGDRRSA